MYNAELAVFNDLFPTVLADAIDCQTQMRAVAIPIRRLVAAGALVIAWLLLMPFAPGMPTGGIDGSWPYGLNEAIARGYVFGRDVVFTFGPLASV